MLHYLAPWEFYPEVVGFCAIALGLYLAGLRRAGLRGCGVNGWHLAAWVLGVVATYAVMHTWIDYLSQYMFWVHRAQHLVLHHVAPFLMVLAMPQRVIPQAFGPEWRARWGRVLHHPLVRIPYRSVQQPMVASILFVGIIFFWLEPEMHFDAMLSSNLYRIMNASMLLEGLLFWWLIVDPRGKADGGLGFGLRILMLWFVMLPQIGLGAWIGLSREELYDVYAVCGRAWPISPLTDQQIGGLITWIPAAMMSVVGALVVWRLWLHESARVGR